ncbi:MAG: response regulator transcription factor [Treponema sp.]|nr:response regulator transcription factor [Treponema sp.]
MISIVTITAQNQDRDKIITLLSADGDIRVAARGKDGYDALKLVGSLKPDIAILDNHLEFIEGEEIPPLLRLRSPSTAIVLIAAMISDYQLYRAVTNEVSAIVHKETDMDSLPGILKCISGGGCFISPLLAARLLHLLAAMDKRGFYPCSSADGSGAMKLASGRSVKFFPREDPVGYLSKMELRILTFISEGLTSAEIALNLGLAVGTVRNYISSVMRKTGMNNRSQMVRYAFSYGLVPFVPAKPARMPPADSKVLSSSGKKPTMGKS